MRLGVVTPVLTLVPGAHAPWERDASFDDVVTIARAADELGYDHLTCSEHVAVPASVAEVRGARYYEPAATLGYLAAVTTRIRLATSVLVLGYHHPLEIVKRYGTLDQVSGGRLVLGVGVGSLREEFDLLGAPFDDRGARADDALRALRASLSTNAPSYRGEHVSFDDVIVDPCATQAHVPIWIGGRTARSLRRAVELGDGWCPFGLTVDELRAMLDAARRTEAWSARDAPLDLVLSSTRAVDPGGDPDGCRSRLDELAALGATCVPVRLVSRSLDHHLDQLARLVEMAGDGL